MPADVKNPANPYQAVTAANWTVEVDASACIGAGVCSAMAPQAFVLNEENKAVILRTVDQETAENLLNAARSCPVSAIRIKNDKGETVFPE